MMQRRKWLRQVPVSAIGAALGPAALLGQAGNEPANHDNQSHTSTRDSKYDAGARVFNVRDFGAKGDGNTLDTAAIQATIDACAQDSGGTVLVPAGVFHVGTLELKSNVTLHLAAAATLLGSADGKQYHAVDAIPLHGDSTLEDGNWALLFAVGARNVTIEGAGKIDGQGIQFHSPTRGATPPSGLGGLKRPYTILCHRCENLRIRELEMVSSAYHCVRVIQSKRVFIDGVHIHNRVNGNNDGFHFISAEHVAISNCVVESQDDACALFGSCKDVTVTNCYFSTRWSVFRFGGGSAGNITVSNCVLHQVYGCPIKFHGSPGSRFENMSFSNLILNDVTGPIHISAGPANHPTEKLSEAQPIVRNISFSNIQGTVTTNPGDLPDFPFTSGYRPGEGLSCIALNSVAGAIVENISFDNVHIRFGGGGTADVAARRDLPQVAGEYFMLGPMPAYGFYARNVRGLTLHNVRLEVTQPDLRPAVIFDGVQDAGIYGLSVQGNQRAESVLRFINSRDAFLSATRLLTPAAVFLQVEGAGSRDVIVEGGDVSKAAKPVGFIRGAAESAVKLRL